MAKDSGKLRFFRDWAWGEALSRLLAYGAGLVGGLAGVQSFIASGNLTVAILVAAFVFGMVALGLNQSRSFYQARSVRSGLVPGNLSVIHLMNNINDTEQALQIGLQLYNKSLRSISYRLERDSCAIDSRISMNPNYKNFGSTIFPQHENQFFMSPINVDRPRPDTYVEGIFDATFVYGARDMPHRLHVRRAFAIEIDNEGKACRINWFELSE